MGQNEFNDSITVHIRGHTHELQGDPIDGVPGWIVRIVRVLRQKFITAGIVFEDLQGVKPTGKESIRRNV